MKLYTCYACTDGKSKWLAIDELPAMQGAYVNEVTRVKLTRPGLLVTVIITDWFFSVKDAIALTNECFDKKHLWETIVFEKSAHNAEIAAKALKRGRR